jgi:hypothetical protein
MPRQTNYKIFDELVKLRNAYDTSVNIIDAPNGQGFLPFRQKDILTMIEFYSMSKYLNGMKDELGRDKPYFQLLNGIVDTENAAKDLDTGDLQVQSIDGSHELESFLLGKDIRVWMNKVNFGKTLNELRDIHSRYGSVLAKKCIEIDEDGKKQLYIKFPAWKNIINDQIDILKSPIAEIHWMTYSEILNQTDWYNQAKAVEMGMKNPKWKYRMPIYELRGEFPKSLMKEIKGEEVLPEDKTTFSYQLYHLAGEIGGKMICVYEEDDTERVYKFLARKAKPGRAFGVGVFEEGEEAQVWTNDAVLKQNRAFEYSSKVVGQSASKKLKGRNILTEVDDGQILEHEDNKPITTVPLVPTGGMAQFQNLIKQWDDQLQKTTSAYDALRGEGATSHTPFRLQALVLQQSKSVFLQLQQEIGIFLSEIFNDWVLPFQAAQLSEEHILAGDFTPDELKEIDNNFAIYEANQQAKEKILSGKIVSQDEYDSFIKAAKDFQSRQGGRRFIKIPKDFYKNLKAKVIFSTTGEQRNKATTLESLTNIMMVYAKNPAVLQDPVLQLLFRQIVELSGASISPVQIMAAINQQAKMKQEAATAAAANPNPANPADNTTPQPQLMPITPQPNATQ